MHGRKETRVAVVGTGAVGSTYAFAAMNAHVCDELVLIDVNSAKAEGDAMDLNHGLPFAEPMRIWQGDYEDVCDADLVVITAGAAQEPGETRLDLLRKNVLVFEDIVGRVSGCGFGGVYAVATNPVDALAYATWKHSGAPSRRVVGTGTLLDTSRFRFLLGEYFEIDPRNVHAYIIGEHGESELPVWSHADVGERRVLDWAATDERFSQERLQQVFRDVRDAAQRIIDRKGATYYAIAMGLLRLTRAVLRNEDSILTVSTLMQGEYGLEDVYIGVPAIVNRQGVREVVELALDDGEMLALHASAQVLRDVLEPYFGVKATR